MRRSLLVLLGIVLANIPSFGELGAGTNPNPQEEASDAPLVKTIRAQGAEFSYVEQGQGEPVVLIHGFAHDYRVWAEQVPELSKHFHVIAYSRRNHYPNPWTDDSSDLSLTQHTADLVALIQVLDLDRVHLVGHSAGAVMAALMARDHPHRVRSIVLGEAMMPDLLAHSQEWRLETEQTLSPPNFFEDAIKAFQQGNAENAFRILVEGIIGKEGAYDELPPAGRRILLDNARSAEAELRVRGSRPSFTCEDAQNIQAPTLLLQGERTLKIFRLSSQELHKCMPASEHTILPNASHALQLENPTAFNEIVLEFLTRHSSRTRIGKVQFGAESRRPSLTMW